jgi:hypothetical protein
VAREFSALPPNFTTLDALSGTDALCLFVGADERPLERVAGLVDWRLCGALSRVLRQRFFVGAAGDWLLVPTGGRLPPSRVFCVGLGPRDALAPSVVAGALRTAAAVLTRAGVESVALEIPGDRRVADADRARALVGDFLPSFGGNRVAVLAEPSLAMLLGATPALPQAAGR